jgi:hypothetical protein
MVRLAGEPGNPHGQRYRIVGETGFSMHGVAATIDALQAPWRSGLSPVSGTAVEDSVAPVDAWVSVGPRLCPRSG